MKAALRNIWGFFSLSGFLHSCRVLILRHKHKSLHSSGSAACFFLQTTDRFWEQFKLKPAKCIVNKWYIYFPQSEHQTYLTGYAWCRVQHWGFISPAVECRMLETNLCMRWRNAPCRVEIHLHSIWLLKLKIYAARFVLVFFCSLPYCSLFPFSPEIYSQWFPAEVSNLERLRNLAALLRPHSRPCMLPGSWRAGYHGGITALAAAPRSVFTYCESRLIKLPSQLKRYKGEILLQPQPLYLPASVCRFTDDDGASAQQ